MGAAAAVIIARERRVVEAFTAAAATSPERARPLDSLGMDSYGMALRRLQDHAVIREAEGGRFYLDLPSWQALRRMRRRLILVLLLAVILTFAVTLIGSRH
jgi:hypothetical protein